MYGGLVFGMSIGLQIWGRGEYSGGILTGFYSIPVLKAWRILDLSIDVSELPWYLERSDTKSLSLIS